ncbi:ABC transporter permease [Candidatus Acetothermia bacterium]|jgi:NitT/TauT family transport system permease protein|nr:ABC transporter permease [Candidatus Acetothermia bacterium]MCI2426906.1 ABC transporter permease [Candidatus Acetothermia bacterium]MCI2427940.1 ABC transporter permease [Candidatus Acetothermia bacterium]
MMEEARSRRTMLGRFSPFFVFLLLLAIWQIIAASGLFLPLLFPSPVAVVRATVELWEKGILVRDITASLSRVFSGFILAAVFAIPLGLLLGWYARLKHAFDPLVQILRPISPIAWIPLAILWFGIGNRPAIFIIFITSLFPILLASISAVKNIDQLIIKSAVNFGAGGGDILRKIVIPASFPYVMVGLRIALGIAWVIIVAAEMVGMRSGLGFMILDARNFLRTDMVVAGMIIIGIIGLILDRIMLFFEKSIRIRWGYRDLKGER